MSPGTYTWIGVNRSKMSKLPFPYSDCISDDDMAKSNSISVKQILKTNYAYRQIDCYQVCFNKYISSPSVCECQDTTAVAMFENVTLCSTPPLMFCDFSNYQTFFKQNIQEKCRSECPLECNSNYFQLSYSFTAFPSYPYYQNLIEKNSIKKKFNSTPTFQDLKAQILAINIFYEG